MKVDARTTTVRPEPTNKLSVAEQRAVLDLCNCPDYAHLPPSQTVPRLADDGVYLASESTFYRVLEAHDQHHRRGRAQAPRHRMPPTSYTATASNQVWSWDITYLPSPVRGQFYYLYLSEDNQCGVPALRNPYHCRKAVGGEVYAKESGVNAPPN